MSRIVKLLVHCLIIMIIATQPYTGANASSLWVDSSAPSGLYGDRKAHAVGDVLTIIISETSSASRTGKAANSKSASANADAGAGIFRWIAAASASASDSFSAQGSVSNTNNVNARLTVQVSEVKPNGYLVVTGKQSIKQNGEEQRIVVTGLVRPEDISPDNTVLSTYVANAEIKIDGHGPLARKQRQGILTQLFNFLF